VSAHKGTRQEDEVSIDQALRLMKTTQIITETVKAGLAVELPGMSTPPPTVGDLAAMRPLTLASRLIGLPDVPEESLLDIARELIVSFRKMLDLDLAAPGPIQVTVVQDKKLSEMNVRELLTALAADPGQFDDIAAAIAGTRQVQQAGQHPWALATPAGTLDVDATAEYLAYLSRPGSLPQRVWPPNASGRRPTTLADIFGRETLIMVNPFTGELFNGLDAWGNDWRKLPDQVHLAMMWAAAETPRHRNLPGGELNARQLTGDLFARRQPAYIREIIEDFAEAQRRDPQLAAMSRYLTVAEASGLAGQAGSPGRSRGRTEEDYRKMLRDVAQSSRRTSGGDIRLGEIVIASFAAMGGDVVLRNTIVLDNSRTMGGDLRGVAFVPRGVSITTLGGDNSLEIYEESYERLARRAGLA
jgi:hypothetical protein